MHSMDDRSGTEKELRFKEGMGHHVKNRRHKRPHAAGHKHVAELRNVE